MTTPITHNEMRALIDALQEADPCAPVSTMREYVNLQEAAEREHAEERESHDRTTRAWSNEQGERAKAEKRAETAERERESLRGIIGQLRAGEMRLVLEEHEKAIEQARAEGYEQGREFQRENCPCKLAQRFIDGAT